jgi:ComF family protein
MFDTLFARAAARTCLRCGQRSWKEICQRCLLSPATRFRTPHGHLVHALGLYDGPAGDFIRRLKYQDETIWASYLGSALARVFPSQWSDCTLVPVPLHPERLAERGYNQSALIARAIARRSGNPVAYDWIARNRHTQAQATLGKVERAENLRQGFSCHHLHEAQAIVVIDDVVTTGSTLDACIDALVNSGAEVRGALACALARETRINDPSDPPTKTL